MKLQVTKNFELYDNEVIDKYCNKTAWFDSPISITTMYNVLRNNGGFSKEQSLVIIASLGLVGVQFTDDVIMIED